MSLMDDPNRECVGLDPAWVEGTGGEVAPPTEPEAEPKEFDPSDHTVAEVEAYIAEHPDEADAVLAAESAGKNRTTLTGGGS